MIVSCLFPMNNEGQDYSLLDWELGLLAAAAADPTPSRAPDRNDNVPVFASRNDAFPNPPGDGGDFLFHEEAPGVPLPNLGTMLGDSDNRLDLRRSESLGNDEMEKDKKEETADYCVLKRGRSVEGHNMSEKRRRKRIRERRKALQALIPNSNKRDTASMLDDAVRYLKLLKLQVKTMSISYGYGGAQNLVPFEGGGGGGYQGVGRPILPRGCIPSPHMFTCCYPHTMMYGFVPNLPPPMPMFPCLFNPRHDAQFSWPPAPTAATDYSDVPRIPSTFNDNIGEYSHSGLEESPRHRGCR